MRSVVLSMNHPSDVVNKVSCIKGVRSITGHGLRDAKDIVDRVIGGATESIKFDMLSNDREFDERVQLIRDGGITAQVNSPNSAVRNNIAKEIRGLITFSTLSSQFDIAKALIDVLAETLPNPVTDDEEEVE